MTIKELMQSKDQAPEGFDRYIFTAVTPLGTEEILCRGSFITAKHQFERDQEFPGIMEWKVYRRWLTKDEVAKL